ncbi:MAG: S8 family serine peptidase, partial [candidate division WOR-3 bacterium]|nr:S8 family serine peptidase [candidate division WOR-3 bacterium]
MLVKSKKSLLIVFLGCIFCTLSSFALTPEEIFREVIVEFKPGTVQLPEGKSSATLTETQLTAPVRSILQKHNTELILKAFPDFRLSDTLGILKETGETVRLANMSEVYKIRLISPENVQLTINELNTLPEVVYAEPNGMAELHISPNDPHFQNGDQWGLNQANDCDIDAPEAWDIFRGSTGIKIGIIDEGVWSSHEDLIGKVSGDAGYGGPHGTHVAGIAAANTNNNKGIAGVDWNARINSQRIDDEDDLPGIYNEIMDAVNAGCHILNNSWGLTQGYSSVVRRAFANAYKLNRVAVASMGNENSSETRYPAGFGQGIIAVGATDQQDKRCNYPGWWGSNWGNHIDVVAPGHEIWSCVTYSPYYQPCDGTSMATPHVSGLAGLLKGYNTDLYNDDIEQIIRISADDKGAPGWDDSTGTGRINARKALDLLRSPYVLKHWEVSGGSVVDHGSSYEKRVFIDVPGLATGTYLAKWYRVQK